MVMAVETMALVVVAAKAVGRWQSAMRWALIAVSLVLRAQHWAEAQPARLSLHQAQRAEHTLSTAC